MRQGLQIKGVTSKGDTFCFLVIKLVIDKNQQEMYDLFIEFIKFQQNSTKYNKGSPI
jgi:hypothetical protein